jgi:hypothetical protein
VTYIPTFHSIPSHLILDYNLKVAVVVKKECEQRNMISTLCTFCMELDFYNYVANPQGRIVYSITGKGKSGIYSSLE